MGKKHFAEEQIALAWRQAEAGTSVAEIIMRFIRKQSAQCCATFQ